MSPQTRRKPPAHRDFAQRMAQACDGNPSVPLPNFGRLRWFVEQLDERFDFKTTPETIRKWFAGETLPRPKTMKMLAAILGVDEAWLALGRAPELDSRQQKLRDAEADGVVNVVAGFVQMCGANAAFPTPDDQRAHAERIDLYAIIRGVQYAFHVALARDGRFIIPVEAAETFVLGVLRTNDLECEFYEVSPAVITNGDHKGGFIEIAASAGKRIRTFAERL